MLPHITWSSLTPTQTRLLLLKQSLTHWGRVTHICVGNLAILGSDNGLSPGRRQAIIWANAGILLTRPWGTNFSGILIKIHMFPFKKMYLKISSGKWRPCCLGLNVLTVRPVNQATGLAFQLPTSEPLFSPVISQSNGKAQDQRTEQYFQELQAG